MRTRILPAAALLCIAASAHAETPAAEVESHAAADFEVDPTAYALDGYSLHVGLGWRRLRVDLGAFALTIPAAIHGNEGFTASFDGFGAKLQYFPLAPQGRLFVGIDAAVARTLVRLDGTDLASRSHGVTAGVHVGWRVDLPARFYASAWIGVSYAFGVDDVSLSDQTYDANPWVIFPAIHLGYRFR